ncbi:unnamed protein product [Leptidea sinapis]|uniref:Uncharacterized protein n=1 Tax=Leptidea sinapis TaxID=189913 RepID=A0A5E4QCP3_9NEOP|nr:unnamed protein product [Leptidea sinapis]
MNSIFMLQKRLVRATLQIKLVNVMKKILKKYLHLHFYDFKFISKKYVQHLLKKLLNDILYANLHAEIDQKTIQATYAALEIINPQDDEVAEPSPVALLLRHTLDIYGREQNVPQPTAKRGAVVYKFQKSNSFKNLSTSILE